MNKGNGGTFMYAKVIIEITAKAVDKTFTYKIPNNMLGKELVGARVKVPFGHQTLEGFVLKVINNTKEEYEIKEIQELVDEKPILNEEMLELGKKISEKTLCSLISAYQAMLPKALKAKNNTNVKIKQAKILTLITSEQEVNKYIATCRYENQNTLLKELLKKKEIEITKQDSTIKTLMKKNLVSIILKEKYRLEYKTNTKDKKVLLNQEQQKVVDRVLANQNSNKVFLLYGVTGSGKTEVYMNIIEGVIKQGKSAIVLVPEISLTPQIVERFMVRFGNDVAILHSGLNDGEKYDEYRKIINGEVHIIVGARSAIFAPIKSLGIIIIDEEHSQTYKQENHPRYHARDIAIMRGEYHNCPVLLGSATPSLESMARAGNNVYELLTLTKRAGKGSLPQVYLVDMKEEMKHNHPIISELLDRKIKEKLAKKEQIILLLNRRGYSSIETCTDCGEVIKCPNCDISLTYHKTSEMLRCHYCGYATKKLTQCPKCKSNNLKDYGLGTQKLEEELQKKYQARIIRMDMDTTSKKGAHQQIIEDFDAYKYDILVGTQMISKGLDFPKVTLVGVINADASLNIPDFRSSERTFQLLCQVSGRAGRSDLKGEVIIQTFNKNHYSIMYAKHHDYLSFYKEEMKIRKQLNYSPYYYMILVKISTKDYEKSFEEANIIGEYLRKNLSKSTYVLGPAMATVFRINNVYYQQCIIKYKKDDNIKDVLIKLDQHYKTNSKVKVEIDIEPNRL